MKKIVTAFLTMALLASCGTPSSKSEPDVFTPALDTSTPCSISVVGDYKNFPALEKEFDKFRNYYKDVKFSYTKVDNYADTIGTVLEGADAPNIFFSYAGWMGGDEKYNTAISHMEDLSAASLKINLNCIRPGLLNRDSSTGKVLMVPIFSRTFGALVNESLFKKEGIAIPSTWNELLTATESFRAKGYKNPMMGYSKEASNSLMYTIAYPAFVAALAPNPDALAKANNLDPSAGEYMRDALTKVKTLIDGKAIDLAECDGISDNYNAVIMRFFEGDVPMMICHGDTASGTSSREPDPKPFDYSFAPIPMTDKGGYFIDSPSIQFSVNKSCKNLDMTNEFMRFLVRNDELNAMAAEKRLVTTTKEISFDSIYAPFGKIPAERTFAPEALGVKDPIAKQIRVAAYKVGKNELSIDQAIAQYGSLK